MFQFDDNFLVTLGLGGMPDEEKEPFLTYAYQVLELRIGTELSKNLSPEQLKQFEELDDSNDPQAAMQWLQQHCPDYKEVVKREIDRLKAEIIAGRDRLLE
jgi:hypothetical protein